MNIILLGPPGAGKGTQAKLIEREFNIPQISTGDMLRSAIQSGSETGLKLQKILDAGELVSDDFIIQLIKQRLELQDCKKGFMLDGVPRTLGQADSLKSFGINIDFVIEISLDDDLIVKRISGRRVHESSGRIYHTENNPPKIFGKDDITGENLIQRNDDKEETVRKRLNVYHNQTSPLINYYKNFDIKDTTKKPLHVKVDGDQSVNKVSQDIFYALRA